MAEPVKPRNWRRQRSKEVRHTSEIHRVEGLPQEVKDYLQQVAELLNKIGHKVAELERQRDEDARETRRICEALDKRISSVTVNIRGAA